MVKRSFDKREKIVRFNSGLLYLFPLFGCYIKTAIILDCESRGAGSIPANNLRNNWVVR